MLTAHVGKAAESEYPNKAFCGSAVPPESE
jgi:hypothetical protein